MTQPEEPVCQMCGMPIGMDPQGGGTESDGSRTTRYCSRCYQNGEFTSPEPVLEPNFTHIDSRLKEYSIPPPAMRETSSDTAEPDRWSNV